MSANRSVDHEGFQLDLPSRAHDPLSEGDGQPSVTGRPSAASMDGGRRMGYRVNYWLLAGTVVLLAVGAPSLHFLRNYQVQRNSQVLISRAEAKEAEEDWRSAADFYHRYLQLVPNDPAIVIARARAFDKSADSPDRANRAIALLFQAVDMDPEDTDLRMRLAERHFEQERWSGAHEQALLVLERDPGRLEAARISALALRAQGGPSRVVPLSDVIDAHRVGLQNHPGDPVLSVSLARLYRENLNSLPDHTPEQVAVLADRVMDRMVAERPEDGEAWLARHRYRRAYELSGAEADLEQSLELAPEKADVLVAAAIEFLETDPQRSLDLAERLRAVEPEEARGYRLLSEVQSRTGKVDEAIATLNQAIAEFGKDNYLLQQMLLTVALDHRRLELARETWEEIGRWLERFSHLMPATNRRRLDEDHQFARAQMLLLEGQADAAIIFLKPLTAVVTEGGDADQNLRVREQRWRMLAEAYGQLQQWDSAAEAMSEAARLRPASYQSVLAEGAMVRRAGDLDRAIQLFQDAASKPEAPARVWLVLAEALIEEEFKRATKQTRDWRRVRSVMERVRPELEGTPEFVALQARWALADGRADDAREELKRILPVDLVPIEAAAELAMLFEAVDESETADALVRRLLEDSQRVFQGDAARVELLVRRRDYDQARQRLDELVSTGKEAEQRELLPRLLGLQLEGGYVQEVREHLARFRDRGPTTVPLLEMGALLAFKAKDWDELSKYVANLEQLEGQSGTVWRLYEALASLESRVDGSGLDISRARQLLRELEDLRPQWPSILIVKGRLAEQQGKADEAVSQYEEAVRQGARGIVLLDWLVAGLYRQNRYAEAGEYLRTMGPLAGISTKMTELALPAYLRQGRVVDAVRMAKTSAELHPNDLFWQLLYGQALSLAGKESDAENVFNRAVELAPNDIRAWGGMVWFHAHNRRYEKVREIVSEVESLAQLGKVERLLLAARGLSDIGDRMTAALRFQELLETRPEDPAILEEAARFHLQRNLGLALDLYRRLLAVSPNSINARRAIALIMGLRGTEDDLEEALQLLRERDQETPSPMDERLELVLLMRGDEQQQAEALSRLTELVASQEPVPASDRLLLAQALEMAKRPDEAQLQYELLLGSDSTADFIVIYSSFLLRHEKYDELETWLNRLAAIDPTGIALLNLRSDWLAATGRADEIVSNAEEHVEIQLGRGSEEAVAALRQAVAILTRHGLKDEAERLLRSASQDHVAAGGLLVNYLVEQDRLDEAAQSALDNATKFAEERPPIFLIQVMTLLAGRRLPDSSLQQRAELEFESAMTRHADDVRFLFDFGTLRVMQGRSDEAIDLYEASLRLRPDFLPSLNNLAIVLSEIPERREESLNLIQKLTTLAPESGEVQDSKAMVLIGSERFDEALVILDKLVNSSPKNARFNFHVAVVRDRLGNTSGAREAFHEAWSHGLESELLTPAEHDFIKQLSDRYGKPTAP